MAAAGRSYLVAYVGSYLISISGGSYLISAGNIFFAAHRQQCWQQYQPGHQHRRYQLAGGISVIAGASQQHQSAISVSALAQRIGWRSRGLYQSACMAQSGGSQLA